MTMRQIAQLSQMMILPRNIVSVVMSLACVDKVVVIHRLLQWVAQVLPLMLIQLISTQTQ